VTQSLGATFTIPVIMLASFRIRTPAIYDTKGSVIMNINLFLSKSKREWHIFRLRYHEILLDGCLDYDLKSKIERKISYHRMKITTLY
jgi:hypothetical protein